MMIKCKVNTNILSQHGLARQQCRVGYKCQQVTRRQHQPLIIVALYLSCSQSKSSNKPKISYRFRLNL